MDTLCKLEQSIAYHSEPHGPRALGTIIKRRHRSVTEAKISVLGMQEAIKRLMTDRDYRHSEQTNSRAALADFDLTDEEIEAISRRDLFKLEELGLEPWTARWVTSLR